MMGKVGNVLPNSTLANVGVEMRFLHGSSVAVDFAETDAYEVYRTNLVPH